MNHPIRVIDAPSNLGLIYPSPAHEPGTRNAPDALRRNNLLARLNAKEGGYVPPPPYIFDLPEGESVRNLDELLTYTPRLAHAVESAMDDGDFPLVLGGDCSILLGSMLGLRQRGRYGLFFLDGHQDLHTPLTTNSNGAAGMDLALVMGYGEPRLTTWEGLTPLVRGEDVVAFAFRDDGTDDYHDVTNTGATFIRLEDVRQQSIAHAVESALARLSAAPLDGIWLHCDVDVLNSFLMPAVDSPQPDGLSYPELTEVLRRVVHHPLCVGLQLTIFDPDLDPTGVHAANLASMLVEVFAP